MKEDRIRTYLRKIAVKRTRRLSPAYAEAMDSRQRDGYIIASDDHHSLEDLFDLINQVTEHNPWYRHYLSASWRVEKVKRFPKEVKWFIQRGRRGYSDLDLWNFNNYLANVISKATAHLSEIAHGFPMMEELTGEYDSLIEMDEALRDRDTSDAMFQQWQRELMMISDGFKLYETDEHVPEETWEKFRRYFPAMWD